MALTAVAFSARFDIVTETIIVTDNTNYAGAGLLTSQVKGVLGVIDPTSTLFYNNTNYSAPDITPSVSLVNSTTISIPEPTPNRLLTGSYTITYTVQVDNGVDPIYYVSGSVTVDFNYCSPTINITQTADCVTPLFTSVDNTQYIVNGITPTIAVQHSLYFPPGSSLYGSPIVISATATGSTISTQTFFTGPQTSIVEATLTYVYADGLTVTDVIQGQVSFIVDCTGVCAVYCCMKSLENRRYAAQRSNKKEYEKLTETLNICMSLMSLAAFSLQCGEQQDAQGYLDKILILGNCTGDCGCGNDGTPVQVTGLTTTGESSLPWVSINPILNDNALIQVLGDITIDSITNSSTFKYKKIGTTVHIAFTFGVTLTRASDTGSERFTFTLPSAAQTKSNPIPCSHGSCSITNVSASPDTETPLHGLIGSSSDVLFLKTGSLPVGTVPVATNTYLLTGSATYETSL